MSHTLSAPNLTQRPPRSPRARLGGYVLLPRMLDKCRATIAGINGEFHYNCPLDQHILKFLDLDPEALKTEVATGKGDGEILTWILANAKNKHHPWEVQAWTQYHTERGPDGDVETLQFFTEMLGKLSTTREDVKSWMDLLDLDDHVTFGGKA